MFWLTNEKKTNAIMLTLILAINFLSEMIKKSLLAESIGTLWRRNLCALVQESVFENEPMTIPIANKITRSLKYDNLRQS